MHTFYFDVSDGNVCVPDVDGTDCADRMAARDEAVAILSDLEHNTLPDGDHQSFAVRVRNERRVTVYEATLVVSGRWLVDQETGQSS